MRNGLMLTLILTGIFSLLLLGMASETSRGALFKNDKFEDNIVLEYTPAIPTEYQKVNVSIRSRDGVALISATLWIEIRGTEFTSSGAYDMVRVNATARSVELNGYASNTNISFYVTAYDGANELRSRTYYYDVASKLSWRYPSFEQNVDLTFGPDPPKDDESVDVLIESRDLRVKITRADFNISVKLPGIQETLSSAVSMKMINDFAFETTVIPYPGDAVVTFSVIAYDEYSTPMESKSFTYTVTAPPEEFRYGIFVVVYNNVTRQYVEGTVTVENEAGYHISNKTVNGIFWTPSNMTEGKYIITVVPNNADESDIKTETIYVDRHTTDFKFMIYYGVEDISTNFDLWEFPSLRILVTFVIIALLFPVVFHLLKKQDEKDRKKEKDKKKEIERKKEGIVKEKTVEKKGFPERSIQKLRTAFENLDRKKDISTAVAFGVLGFFGAMWCPFYPWWMVLLISLLAGAIGYRFPFLSLIFVSFVGIGSTAYQTPQFGLMFMVFSLIVCVCSLFNWKFGYLSFLTIFLSTFGISFLVPVFAIFLFSLFLSTTVTVVSGIFLSLLAATGNMVNLSFIVTSYATEKDSIATFSRVPGDDLFSPHRYFDAVGGIRYIDLDIMSSFINNYMTTMIPLVQVILWVAMVLVIHMLRKRFVDRERTVSIYYYSAAAAAVLLISTIGGMALADFETEAMIGWKMIIVYLLSFPAMLFVITLSFILRNAYSEYYVDRKTVGIGTRIGDGMGFRRSTFENVGGLKDVKDEIKDSMIGPLLRPEMSREYGVEPPKGIILFGPPGCGKTLLMRVIASELKVEMIGVKCSDIMSKWYGESENLINDLFKIAREKRPCLLFLDEIDAIAKRRDFYSADDVTPRLLSIMLSEMDGMDEFSEIIIIGATNKPELIDPALLRPGRFDKIIYVPPPDLPERMEILGIHLKGKPTAKNIDLRSVAKHTDGYSGADLANLCRECATHTMRRAIETRKASAITMRDFRDMIRILKPSLSKEMKEEYEELQQHYERKLKKKAVKKGEIDELITDHYEGERKRKKGKGRGKGRKRGRRIKNGRFRGGRREWEEDEDDYNYEEDEWVEEDHGRNRRYR